MLGKVLKERERLLVEMKGMLASIQTELPEVASELAASIDLLLIALASAKEEAAKLITTYISGGNFNRSRKLHDLAESIDKTEKQFDEYLDLLETGVVSEELADEEDTGNLVGVVDYSQYEVDQRVVHSLYEDFKHVRPYGFMLHEGPLHQVRTWKEMVVTLCQQLDGLQPNVLTSFPENKRLNGRKNAYFAFKPGNLRAPVAITDSIFLEGNQSANALRNLMLKVLPQFGVSPSDMKVFFRADYSNIPSRR